MEKKFENKDVTWLISDSRKWQLFNNIQQKDMTTTYQNNKVKFEGENLFYYANKNREQKGTIVFTPEGFGVIQNYSKEKDDVDVRIKSKLYSFDKKFIQFEITIKLNVMEGDVI